MNEIKLIKDNNKEVQVIRKENVTDLTTTVRIDH